MAAQTARTDSGRGRGLGVPPAGPGVCGMCHGPARDGRALCWCCRAVSVALDPTPGSLRCPVVVPAALYRTGDRLHRVLRGYKDASAVTARRHFAGRLGVHLSEFLGSHGPCIAGVAGATWDSVAVVPSSTRTPCDAHRLALPGAGHPLGSVVEAMSCLSGLARIDIARGTGTAQHLAPAHDAFVVGDEARGRRVLLLDDTWVTGARVRSAAVALGRGGAEVVAIVVAGRAVGGVEAATVPAVAKWWRWAEAQVASGAAPSTAHNTLHDGVRTRARCCVTPCAWELSAPTLDR